jgi:hypothetical protein
MCLLLGRVERYFFRMSASPMLVLMVVVSRHLQSRALAGVLGESAT